jgi:hypothetical protein
VRALRVTLACLAVLLLAPAFADGGHRPDPRQFLIWNAAHRTVDLTLLAGLGASNNGFNFDGYGRGELLVTVPRGWRVATHCVNRGSMRHSCAVVSGAISTRAAFAGATTPDPLAGLQPGAKATFFFVPTHTGTYRIACLVPGHEQARMYAVLVVAARGLPSIRARPGP